MRIGIVNDMAMAAEILRRVVSSLDGCQVAWLARNGQEAIEHCAADTPDLVLMDLVMPGVDGVEATRRIMQRTPCPILIVTASVSGNSDLVYEAMGYGALDVVATPALGRAGATGAAAELIRKIEQIALVTGIKTVNETSRIPTPVPVEPPSLPPLIAIGASTGGPNAVARVLSAFPSTIAAATVIVQHVDEQFAPGLADWLGKNAKLPVALARRGIVPQPANVYVAATNDHLCFNSAGAFVYSEQPRGLPYRPSVDVFFSCVAKYWKAPVVGVLLTGMGRDGARGLLELRQAGYPTIAQDEDSSVVYGMPKAAAEIAAAAEVLPLDAIGPAVLRHLATLAPR